MHTATQAENQSLIHIFRGASSSSSVLLSHLFALLGKDNLEKMCRNGHLVIANDIAELLCQFGRRDSLDGSLSFIDPGSIQPRACGTNADAHCRVESATHSFRNRLF